MLTFAQFSAINRRRCESTEGFNHPPQFLVQIRLVYRRPW